MSQKIQLLREMGKEINILYVEDEEKLRTSTTQILNKIFPTVYVYENGEDGFNGFIEHSIDVVITDLKMPKINGLNMSKMIREVDKNVKIIFMTAFDDKQILKNSIALNIAQFISKPVSLDEFIEGIYPVVEEVFNKKEKAKKGAISLTDLHSMINSQKKPIALIANKKIEYYNEAFLDMFAVDDIEELQEKLGTIDKIIHTKDMYYDKDKHEWGGDNLLHETPFTIEISAIDDTSGLYLVNANTQLTPDNEILLTFMDMQALSLNKNKKESEFNKEHFENILDTLTSLAISKLPITIYNTFKGLPIEDSVTIDKVEGDIAFIHLDPRHLAAINYERKCILLHSAFGQSVKAEMVKKDGNTVHLGGFKYTEYNPKEDNILSLELEKSSVVEIKTDNKKFLANLFKLSTRHIFINDCDGQVQLGENIAIRFEIEYRGTKKAINLHGEVVLVEEDMIEVNVYPNDTTEGVIAEYISKRQLGLIRELKNRLH